MYLSHSFVLYALIVGVSIALCAAMVGVTLVLKRFSFIGDGLSHVAFGAMTVGTILHVSSNLYVTMPITISQLYCCFEAARIARLWVMPS